jgi:hypothetical protein
LATGLASPAPSGDAPLVVGIRDASHILAFAQGVGAILAPDKLSALDAGKTLLRLIGGVDLDEDLFRQFPGTTTVLSDLRTFSVRADARDPGALSKALDRIKPLTGRLLDGIGLSGAGVDEHNGIYSVRRGGRTIARYAAVGKALVVTTDPRVKLAAIAAARPSNTTPERRGALTLRLKGQAIQDVLVRLLKLPPIAKLALAPLQGATGAVRAERNRIEGTIDVTISG